MKMGSLETKICIGMFIIFGGSFLVFGVNANALGYACIVSAIALLSAFCLTLLHLVLEKYFEKGGK